MLGVFELLVKIFINIYDGVIDVDILLFDFLILFESVVSFFFSSGYLLVVGFGFGLDIFE